MLLFTRILFLSAIFLAFITFSSPTDAGGSPTIANYNVSLEECLNAAGTTYLAPLCCHAFVEIGPIMDVCRKKFDSLTPTVDKLEQIIQLSTLSECYYKGKKYIKSNYVLNIGRVKADAAKDYGNGTFAARFKIQMYRFCAREAKTSVAKVQKIKNGDEYLKRFHHPYFLFIFNCVMNFSTKKCPYFHYIGGRDDGADNDVCFGYAQQCIDKYLDEINSHDV